MVLIKAITFNTTCGFYGYMRVLVCKCICLYFFTFRRKPVRGQAFSLNFKCAVERESETEGERDKNDETHQLLPFMVLLGPLYTATIVR